jgi:hypothetical protein
MKKKSDEPLRLAPLLLSCLALSIVGVVREKLICRFRNLYCEAYRRMRKLISSHRKCQCFVSYRFLRFAAITVSSFIFTAIILHCYQPAAAAVSLFLSCTARAFCTTLRPPRCGFAAQRIIEF